MSQVPSIAGTTVLALREALGEIVGHDVVSRAIARLPPDLRDELGSLTPVSWVEELRVAAMHDAVAREAGIDAELLFDQAVRRAAERSLKTVWRVLLHFTSDDALISRSQSSTRARGASAR